MTLFDLEVFEPDAATSIAPLVLRQGVGFLHELNGDGSGKVQVHLDDATLIANPTLLDAGNVVKVSVGGSEVFAWILGAPTSTQVSSEENAGRWKQCEGAGVRTVLATTTVFPENQGIGQPFDLRDTFSDNRATDFSSYIGPWKVIADWLTPYGVVQKTDTTGTRGGAGGGNYPVDWVDGNAQWIWFTDPTATALVEINYFRNDFNLATDTLVGIWASGDNRLLSLRLDGEEIAADDPTELYGWKKTQAAQPVLLAAGNHTLAAAVENRSGPGGFLCTVGTLDSAGDLDTVISRTDTTHWQVHAGAPVPGWTVGQILVKFVQDSQLRSEIPDVALTFGNTVDSAGNAWPERLARTWRVGSDLLDVLNQLIASGYDADMSPDLILSVWDLKGTDRTATVTLDTTDLLSHSATEDKTALRNSVLVRYGDRSWILVEDAASITAHGRRSTSITVGSTDSLAQAQAAGEALLTELAQPQTTVTVTMTSEKGPQPYINFFVGDRITAPGVDGSPTELRLMSIAGEEQENYISWTLQFYPANPVAPGVYSRVAPSMRGKAGHVARVKQAVERMAPGSASGRASIASPAHATRKPASSDSGNSGSAKEAVRTITASGSAQTLADVTAATIHHITLTANCTFTFPTAAAGKSFTVVLKQDGTGSRTATWPSSVKWSAGTAPTLTTTAAKRDVFSFMCADGSTWIGFTAAQNLA